MMENHAAIGGLGGATTPYLMVDPGEIIADSKLSKLEKRAMLADWASDARAVEDAPELRQLDNGAFVRIDDVLSALRLLDKVAGRIFPAKRPPFVRQRRALVGSRTFENDPDELPPGAAGARIPLRPVYTMAKAVPLAKAA
jgi:hypothetical protein